MDSKRDSVAEPTKRYQTMTRKGAQIIIESLSQRFLEIQEIRERLDKEEASVRTRILELEQIQDSSVSVMPIVIVNDEVLNGQG